LLPFNFSTLLNILAEKEGKEKIRDEIKGSINGEIYSGIDAMKDIK
jgi:flagellar basal body-associated protein FliL